MKRMSDVPIENVQTEANGADTAGQRARIALLILTLLLAAASCVKAPDFAYEGGSLWLQHLGTCALALPLLADLKLRRLSLPVCICLFLFICLHILGARYLYSNVPYDRWAARYLNWNVELDAMHGNKFDRLVHFAFGLLLLPLFFQIAERWFGIGNFVHALLVAWLFVQSFSLLYEVFEWVLSVVMSPEEAEGYNGQQGDVWDAQKDMFLALTGSTVTAAFLALRHFAAREKRSVPKDET
jgi:putative membrane protein